MNPICIPAYEHRKGINWRGFFPILVRSIDKIVIEFSFGEDSKYDYTLEDGTVDRDQEDWNKLGGIVFNPFKRDKDAVLAGWRYNLESRLFEVCAYFNHNDANLPIETNIVKYEPGEPARIEIERTGTVYNYRFFRMHGYEWIQRGESVSVKVRKNFFFAYRSEYWFGGANNSPGPFGGVYPDDICFDWSLKIQ